MLPKEKRLNLSDNFRWVASGRREETQNFKLFFKLSDNPFPRVGISLSKREIKKAHDRNKAKRLTSRVVQKLYLKLNPGLNLVIMPKSSILTQSEESLFKEISGVKALYSIN